MAGRVRGDNDPAFPVFTTDWQTGEEENDMVYREGKWWTRFNWMTKRMNLFREKERVRKNLAIRQFFAAQPIDPGL